MRHRQKTLDHQTRQIAPLFPHQRPQSGARVEQSESNAAFDVAGSGARALPARVRVKSVGRFDGKLRFKPVSWQREG